MRDKKSEFFYAFPMTVPVLAGYLFLGAAYGILMKVNGYGIVWVFFTSLAVFAGSLQYLGVTLLIGMVNPLYVFLMGLMINARHLFYGISMMGRLRDMKRGKPYLIFAMTDETFSVMCEAKVPKELDRNRVYLWIALLDHSYWVLGSCLGAVLGSLITFNTKGLDFALTALFTVIFVDQWKSQKRHGAALTGVLGSVLCLIICGASVFIIPAMVLILAVLSCFYIRKSSCMSCFDGGELSAGDDKEEL